MAVESNFNKDIRGLNFEGKTLKNPDFKKVLAGQKSITKFVMVSFFIIVNSCLPILAVISGGVLASVIHNAKIQGYKFEVIEASTIVYAAAVIGLPLWGYKVEFFILLAALILISAIISIGLGGGAGIWVTILIVGINIALAWLVATVTAFSMALTAIGGGNIANIFSLLGSVLIVTLSTVQTVYASKHPRIEDVYIISIAAFLIVFSGSILALNAVKGAPKFEFIKEQALLWAAKGGTSFYGVDLTDACFDGAHLPHTDFRKADLTRASFKGATGLELALLKDTLLECPKIRYLLTNNDCQREIYSGLDLKGANLKDSQLQKSNFMEADLSGADLRKANLEGAILTGAKLNKANLKGANLDGAILVKVQALEADFSDASLTGACIQDWSINDADFNDVRGKYIFLKLGQHQGVERQPTDREFQPGEFEKWIKKSHQVFDLIFRQKLELSAFLIALAQTANEHEGVDTSHFIIEKNGNSILAKLGVFQGADTSAIPQSFINYYKDAVVIQGEEHNIVMNSNAEVKIVENKKETHVGGDIIGGDKGDKTTVGNITAGDVTGSALVGDLSGQVSVTIQQLKDVKAVNSDELVNILTALQEAIPGDSALSETQQRSALKAVETIAKEGKKPPKERDSDICSMALDALTGVTATVTNVSKLAELVEKYLPTLTQLLKISL